MLFSVMPKLESRENADVIVLPFWQKNDKPKAAFTIKQFVEPIKAPLETEDFQGKSAEISLIYLPKGHNEKRCLLLGLGKEENLTVESLRVAYGNLIKFCQKKNLFSLNLVLPLFAKGFSIEEGIKGICEGILLSNYKWDLKSHPERTLINKIFLIGAQAKHQHLINEYQSVAESVYFARDLINGNADIITPSYLVETAKQLEKRFPKTKLTVFDKKRLEKEKMGLILAVGRGAAHDPALIILSYKGDPLPSAEHTVILGKGVTFDTGGLNLKPTGSMETMRDDMSGAACVLSTLAAIAELNLKVNVTAVVPTVENAIDAKSFKPGDVYTSYSGKTVEIGNTDAEGRLILADALAYSVKNLSPTQMIDLATLTGSMVIALGEGVCGMMCNDSQLTEQLKEASSLSNEILWPLPLHPPYKELLKSDIADLKNVGGRAAGAITAALFLEEFVENIPWAHLDIAGTAFGSKEKDYLPKNGIGFGVRLLVEFFKKKSK